jgi:hypothetical protein
MDILKKVDEFKKKGIIIEVNAIDQIENGMQEQVENGLMPLVTYTVNVMLFDMSNILYAESCDWFSEALLAGIKYTESII